MSTSTTRYGATPEEWEALTKLFGSAILPSVCSPDADGTDNAAVGDVYKTPSFISRASGKAYRMKGWQMHEATPTDIAKWSADDRIGICAITREIQAVDIDTNNADDTLRVLADLPADWPMRCGKAGRATLFVRVESPEPLRKQVLRLKNNGGAIEFLATGNQSMLAGTHKSGSRYYWPEGLPTSIPTVTLAEFDTIWNELSTTYGDGEAMYLQGANTRARGGAISAVDPFADVLRDSPNYWSESGDRIYLHCPWKGTHTDGLQQATGAAYMGANTLQPSSYKCLHASCEHRNISHLHAYFSYDPSANDFDVPPAPPAAEDKFAWRTDPNWKYRKTKNGDSVIADDMLNLRVAYKYPILCNGMEFQKDTFMVLPNVRDPLDPSQQGAWQPMKKEHLTQLKNSMADDALGGFSVRCQETEIQKQLDAYLMHKTTDSAVSEMNKLPVWDGVHRLHRLAPDILRTADTPYNCDLGVYMMLTLALRMSSVNGSDVQGTVVMYSRQGTGKSHFIANLALKKDSYKTFTFSREQTEMRRALQGATVLELAEMVGHSNVSADVIKAFINASEDSWRRLYEESDTKVPRRCIFVGSTNNEDVIKDPSGERRLFIMRVGETMQRGEFIDTDAYVANKQQYFAEAKAMLAAGGQRMVSDLYVKLNTCEEANQLRMAFTRASPYHEDVLQYCQNASQQSEISIPQIHRGGQYKFPLTHDFISQIALSLIKMGCTRIEGSVNKYTNIFYTGKDFDV